MKGALGLVRLGGSPSRGRGAKPRPRGLGASPFVSLIHLRCFRPAALSHHHHPPPHRAPAALLSASASTTSRQNLRCPHPVIRTRSQALPAATRDNHPREPPTVAAFVHGLPQSPHLLRAHRAHQQHARRCRPDYSPIQRTRASDNGHHTAPIEGRGARPGVATAVAYTARLHRDR